MIAATTITGDTLSTTNGSATLTTGSAGPPATGGEIKWGTLTVGTTLDATSNKADIMFGSATSGGTQTISAQTYVSFNALTTNGGVTGDPGNIEVTASTGSITATAAAGNNPPTEVSAYGSATLIAATTITGDTLSTTNGSATLTTGSAGPPATGGDIKWTTLNVGTALNATAYDGNITFATATSGGTQTIGAQTNVSFNALTTNGGVTGYRYIEATASTGSITATAAAGNNPPTEVSAYGSATLIAATTITGDTLSTTNGSATLTTGSAGPPATGGEIKWGTLTVGTTLDATSNKADIMFGSATSGGTQTTAQTYVSFNALTTNGGVTGDPGNIEVTASTGSITATAAAGNNPPTEVSAYGSATLIAATTITGDTLSTTNGSATLTTGSAGSPATGGDIKWTTLNVGTALNATAYDGNITFATATSGGTQTIGAQTNVSFNALTTNGGVTGDPGNIEVTASTGSITATAAAGNNPPTEVSAYGSATLIAATTITGDTLSTTNGSATLTTGSAGPPATGGEIKWGTLTVGTTLDATSNKADIMFGSATSGGTQTISAQTYVSFNALTTNGVTVNGVVDPGNINVTASNGSILGQTVGSNPVTEGSVSAFGSASLIAATTNIGNKLTTTNGSAVLQGTVIDWNNLQVATTLGITATTGTLTVGTATSGGTQTLTAADNIVFNQLTTTGIVGDVGDVDLTSTSGSVLGGSISANGDATKK